MNKFLPLIVCIAFLFCLSGKVVAQRVDDPKEAEPDKLVDARTRKAIERGLKFLARKQVKTGSNKGAFGQGGYAGGVATCGLGGLAFMCNGSAPGEGKYGDEINRCVEFLVKCTNDTGYVSTNAGTENMYGHGFATLFMAQAYGMTPKKELGIKLRASVKLIVDTQNSVGGWRYRPVKSDADLSITICQIMALRAARDAGVNVPDETRKKCIDYVKKSQAADGGFRYTLGGGHTSFPLTAAGVVSLYSAGIYEGEAVQKALKYINRHRPGSGSSFSSSYFYYAHYYAVQAMWHAGGENWKKWYPAIRDHLLKQQQGDGSWSDSHGSEFATAMACIILQIPYNYLPVFSP
ncbi:MAG: prenyltransferase/squalene oxidase repeat-containing protein [Planctomycetota bacterium]|nr:prenyltransferase/squalene oxidase repeat-containing protein [Planctomycetota bacterium]